MRARDVMHRLAASTEVHYLRALNRALVKRLNEVKAERDDQTQLRLVDAPNEPRGGGRPGCSVCHLPAPCKFHQPCAYAEAKSRGEL